tara:strand:+ start:145 stop:396 length:252 start_codon:yes stop_codon:yes gene_type:complete
MIIIPFLSKISASLILVNIREIFFSLNGGSRKIILIFFFKVLKLKSLKMSASIILHFSSSLKFLTFFFKINKETGNFQQILHY